MTKRPKMPRASGPEDEALGDKIRARRITAGLSQSELGKALGVSFQQVQKYEKGVNRVSMVRLEKIAEACGETIAFFASDKRAVSKSGQEMQALMADPINQRMLSALSKLKDTKLRWHFVHLVENVAGA